MARAFACSLGHLSKVLQRLTKVGLLSATRGPTGGFGLAKPAKEITMLKVFEAVDGKLTSTSGKGSLVGTLLQAINNQVRDRFASTTMDSKECTNWYKYVVKRGPAKS